MKQRTPEQKFLRKLLAENIIAKRKTSLRIRDYALYDLGNRSINGIYSNIQYLQILTHDWEKLQAEYSKLMEYYLKLTYMKNK